MEQYSNSCRICLCYISDNKSPGHDAMKSNPDLIKVYFEKCTKIKILEDEPQSCCLFCFTELRDFCKFLEKCDKTQKLLDDVRKSQSIGDYSQYIEPEIDDEFNLKQEIEWTGEGLSEILETEVSNPDAFNGDQCWMESKTKKSQKICPNEGGTESKQLKVICPYCGSLVKSTYLENHIKFVHMEPKNSYICDICKTQLSSKKSIIRHMTHVHLRTQKFKCKLCDVQFPTESLRKAHLIQIHNVQPPKACPYCQYRAFTKAHITRHIQRHRGDRRFKCPTCDFAFVTLLQLQTHQAVHSSERNFECNECFKRFKTKKNLYAHKKCHLAYEYECAVCKRAFLTNQMMRNHVIKNHEGFELPPPGTVLNKNAIKRMKNLEEQILKVNS